MWCIPGAPLQNELGWQLWYGKPGSDDFVPRLPKVYQCTNPALGRPQKRSSAPVEVELQGSLLPRIKEIGRRIFIATLKIIHNEHSSHSSNFYWVEVPELTIPLILNALPPEIPSDGLSFILGSCFWRNDDKQGCYAAGVHNIMQRVQPRPSFKVLTGDQIYLDYPLVFRNLREKVYQRYQAYWGDDAYRSVLSQTPNFLMCGDHEFWNNYPEKQFQFPYTYCAKPRNAFEKSANQCFEYYQQALNPCQNRWYQFNVSPVSFFVTDTRSNRTRVDAKEPHFFDSAQWKAIETWQFELQGPGILILSEPLFQSKGDRRDYTLSNFDEDYGRLLNLIQRSFNGDNKQRMRHDIVILSGDIHHGRHAIGLLGQDQVLHEFVASPASRVGPFLCHPRLKKMPTKICANYKNRLIRVTNIQVVSKIITRKK